MNGKAKILVTGSKGMLGSEILKKYSESISLEVDITDRIQLQKFLETYEINIIIHAAAWTDVDGCEEEQDKAYRINTLGTQNLVNYCIDKDILFIFISSTGIYGDKKEEPYTEFDEVFPTTIHHKSKYEAEKIIQNHLSRYLIIRTGWLYGGDKLHKKNFVYKRYLEALENDLIISNNQQFGNPTSIKDLIEQIDILIKYNQYGIFNCVNKAKSISRYLYVKKIIELFEVECSVKVASLNQFTRSAPVSKNESASNYKLELLNLNVMRNWEDALKEYIGDLQNA